MAPEQVQGKTDEMDQTTEDTYATMLQLFLSDQGQEAFELGTKLERESRGDERIYRLMGYLAALSQDMFQTGLWYRRAADAYRSDWRANARAAYACLEMAEEIVRGKELWPGAKVEDAVQEALDRCNRGTRIKPDEPWIYKLRAQAHVLLAQEHWIKGHDPREETRKATEDAQEAIRWGWSNPSCRYLMGFAARCEAEWEEGQGLDARGSYERAEENLEKALPNVQEARKLLDHVQDKIRRLRSSDF
jgi:tetratricopeptide (TPR) repeat protein